MWRFQGHGRNGLNMVGMKKKFLPPGGIFKVMSRVDAKNLLHVGLTGVAEATKANNSRQGATSQGRCWID